MELLYIPSLDGLERHRSLRGMGLGGQHRSCCNSDHKVKSVPALLKHIHLPLHATHRAFQN